MEHTSKDIYSDYSTRELNGPTLGKGPMSGEGPMSGGGTNVRGRDQCQGEGPMSGGGNTVKEIHCHYCVVQLFFVTVIYGM